MSKSKDKIIRYKSLFSTVVNWPSYLFRKMIGFKDNFEFVIRNFGSIKVKKNMMGPFRENFFDNIYFRHIPESIYNHSNPVIIDIGGNVGFFSLATFSRLNTASIFAFEPHPYVFSVMEQYHQTYPQFQWSIFNQAVSNTEGTLTINTSTLEGFTTVASVFENQNKKESFNAEMISLGKIIKDQKLEQVDFIKIDCEGAEYSILYELGEEAFSKIKSMCIETHRGTDENQTIQALNNFILKCGYTTKVLDERKYTGYIWAWRED